ncbi:hypothetical protein [Jatrophihabitans sp.]|uniref:hypothetical protein n=1 Tax=Jatrophihabitans sp. TaxID=1932789 RepID=UPI002F00501B
MPGDPTSPRPGDRPVLPGADAAEARDYLEAALRAARSAAVRAGADPGEVTADLEERVRRVRRVLAANEGEQPPGEE